jgi:citrate lyase subunit beta/citryl-CoA lyase
MKLRRSCLSVPATSERMIAKARSLHADMVFIDLEDSVAPSHKNDATRKRVVEELRDPDWKAQTRAVRVNGVGTEWCWRDITAVVGGAGADLHCLMIPKVRDASHVHFVDRLLDQLELELRLEQGTIGLELQIETAQGAVWIEEIAAASSRTETLIFGPGDYAASLGIPQLTVGVIEQDYPGDQWHYICSRIVTTARAFGLQAIDGPYAQIRDAEGFAEVARRARLLGMDGKWAIHPNQIEPLNEIFSPTQEHFDLAVALLAAYDSATRDEGRGAVEFRGEMIDEATRKMALAVEAAGRAAGLRGSISPSAEGGGARGE